MVNLARTAGGRAESDPNGHPLPAERTSAASGTGKPRGVVARRLDVGTTGEDQPVEPAYQGFIAASRTHR
jgi:hypothetical protein